MNQIIYIESKKKGKSKGGPLEISTAGKLFAILIIIFGVILAGQGVFAMFGKQENEVETSIPSLLMEQRGATIVLRIKHDKAIDKIMYSWNNEPETVLQGRGRNIVEEEITGEMGENLLNIRIVDIFGKEATYSKEIEIKSSDTTKPEIEVLVQDTTKIKISVKDETALDYVIYYWNDEDETKIVAKEESPKLIEERLEVLKGENTLNIIAVDKAGNKTEKQQKCVGSVKPKVQITKDDNTAKVVVTHDQNIQKIEYTINGTLYSTDATNTGEPLGVKEYTYNFPLTQGENTINVKAYNTEGYYEEVTQKITL